MYKDRKGEFIMKKNVICKICKNDMDIELYEIDADFDTNTGVAVFYCSHCDVGTRIEFDIVNIREVK